MNRTIDELVLGSAPGAGADDDALVVGIWPHTFNIRARNHVRVRREGAPNGSRGGCAPHFHVHDYENQS